MMLFLEKCFLPKMKNSGAVLGMGQLDMQLQVGPSALLRPREEKERGGQGGGSTRVLDACRLQSPTDRPITTL